MDTGQQASIPNPRQRANIVSVLLWCWTIGLFKKGYRKVLGLDDLYEPLRNDRSSVLGDRRWNENVKKAKRLGKSPNLLKTIYRTFMYEYIVLGCIQFLNEIIVGIGTPLVLGALLQYFKAGEKVTGSSYYNALLYAGGISLASAVNAIAINQSIFRSFHAGGRIRIASLRLSKAALNQVSPGKIVNLTANDVNRLEYVSIFWHYMWSAPLTTLTITVFLYHELYLIMQYCLRSSAFCGKLASKYRTQTAQKTDERVRLMDEIISGVQVIKMYAWEKPFCALVQLARRLELKIVRKSSYLRGMFISFNLFTTRLALFGTLVSLSFLDSSLITADRVFVYTSYFNLLAHVMSNAFVRGIVEVVECVVAARRLQNFLLLDEFDRQNVKSNVCLTDKTDSRSLYLSMINNDVGFDEKVNKSKKKLNLTLVTSNLVQRYSNCRGSDDSWIVKFNQVDTAWNFDTSNSVLDDVNLEVKKGKLYVVIGAVGSGKSSLLSAILGEMCLIRGSVSIQGKLAYASQEAWVFGASVRQNILFGQAYDEERYEKVVEACALEKDFKQFPYGDQTIVGERGSSLSGGQKARINLARAVYRQANIYLLDDPLSAVDAHVGKHLFDKCLRGYLGDKTRVLATHQLQYLKGADVILLLDQGRVRQFDRYSDLLKDFPEYENLAAQDAKSKNNNNAGEDNDKSVANVKRVSFYTIIVIICLVATKEQPAHNDTWTEASGEASKASSWPTEYYMYAYSGLVASILLFGLLRSLTFYSLCLRSSQVLHDLAFRALVRTRMRFFDQNPSGRILNRFSKDMGSIDELLPRAMLDAGQYALMILGYLLVSCTVNPIFLAPIALIAVIFYLLRRVYLKTSKNIKRLEGMTRSPVFTHLNATLNGLSTIRAYRVQDILKKEFDQFQDVHTSSWFMFIASSSAFGFSIDIFYFIFTALVTFSFLLVQNDSSSGSVGLAITQVMAVSSMLQWGMRNFAEVSNQLMSVERVLEYTKLPAESNFRDDEVPNDKSGKKAVAAAEANKLLIEPPVDWPCSGRVTFDDVRLKYSDEDQPVLKNLSFTIEPTEKVGVVGRTGAGKSSLIAALFRLADVEGSIMIDGLDTANLALEDLRKHISIIPQDPVLFTGTLRYNLDPFGEFTDDQLYEVLEEVELKEAVKSTNNGLENRVHDRGSNYSVGQRQLICLARAILRNNRVLMLDEATANVDPQTDALIQKTIRTKFAPCTVLTVAHRLNTIMDSDKVLVMDQGRLVVSTQSFEIVSFQNDREQVPDR
ncbi:unnamed protein product [Trichogramma brassicae]|uniref:Multidrug resistance-associated protein lethal(2)03659 n=1 Tax=Trichogramma brassicae TaxID=86971 RepID=A0A6H5IHY9_9HYME|nr:unnamed protein product [Trichogramma brassicae]